MISLRNSLAALALMLPVGVQAGIWQDLTPPGQAAKAINQTSAYYRALKADRPQLEQLLAQAPVEFTSSQGATLELPLPHGGVQRFEVVDSPIMSPALADKHPEISTYSVKGIDNPAITGRLDLTPAGFHAMLSTPGGTVFIDPDKSGNYRSFYKQDFVTASEGATADHVCRLGELGSGAVDFHQPSVTTALRTVSSNQRRVYRLAVAATGEYTQYFGGNTSLAVSNIVTAVNRVNQIYGRDLAVQLQLTATLIFTDPFSDPYSHPDAFTMLSQNQDALDFEVGVDSYDLGHLFGLAGGGLAQLGAACTNLDAHGYTGFPTPDSDVFYIDLLAHEMGHQLDATHSFNGSTDACSGLNRSPITAVEPGSGSTIMAYAGICGGEDIQANSDAVFHSTSIQQINNFVFSGVGRTCGTLVSTGNAIPTLIDAGPAVTIPQGTPFVLTGQASGDPDGDMLSYQWDQIDVGPTATTVTTLGTDLGDNPLFRSFLPKSTPTRYFPRLSSLLAGSVDKAETLPTTPRNLNFRLTVRDGNSGLGDDDRVVSVASATGPFQINSVTQGAGTLVIDWDPADTASFCNTLNVSLMAFANDGSTYCDAEDNPDLDLGTLVNASGSDVISLPTSLSVTRARVMLSCATSVFFAFSDTDLTISTPNAPVASDCKTIDGEVVAHGGVTTPPAPGGGVNLPSGGGGGALFWLTLWLTMGGLLKHLSERGRRVNRNART
ncbi:MAG: hypothetical protein KZQ75_13380 [Candidatus Thiodiazotropha sp. (ex Myrtea spinifera)]|nr:hypothetical protein [Candidatus Thiodiazotropha sp. (ex Myrtea spinifera)]